jgi:hypothetical protein
MTHRTTARFWECYHRLPDAVRRLADANFQLLKADSSHPSLHFKKAGRFWSARIGIQYRALAVESLGGPIWFWIGSHAEYDQLVEKG